MGNTYNTMKHLMENTKEVHQKTNDQLVEAYYSMFYPEIVTLKDYLAAKDAPRYETLTRVVRKIREDFPEFKRPTAIVTKAIEQVKLEACY